MAKKSNSVVIVERKISKLDSVINRMTKRNPEILEMMAPYLDGVMDALRSLLREIEMEELHRSLVHLSIDDMDEYTRHTLESSARYHLDEMFECRIKIESLRKDLDAAIKKVSEHYNSNVSDNPTIASNTIEAKFPQMPRTNIFDWRTHLYVMDSVPENVIAELEYQLVSWDEIYGYYKAQEGVGIIDLASDGFEVPDDIQYTYGKAYPLFGKYIGCVGDRIITNDNNVYKVVGFINSDGYADIYYNVK